MITEISTETLHDDGAGYCGGCGDQLRPGDVAGRLRGHWWHDSCLDALALDELIADNLVLFTTPGCVQCRATARAFDREGLEWIEVDLSTNPEAMAFVKDSLGYTSAPVVTTATGTHWSGFQPERITALVRPVGLAS